MTYKKLRDDTSLNIHPLYDGLFGDSEVEMCFFNS